MRLNPAYLLLAALVPASVAQANTPKKIGIAIFDLAVKGDLAPELGASVGGLIATEATRTGVFEVVTQSQIKHLISFDRMRTALTCDEESCLAEIGGALGVPYLLNGSIAKLGDSLVLHLVLTDLKQLTTVGRETYTADNLDNLRQNLGRVVQKVLAPVLFEHKGFLEITCDQVGATVKIDDRVLGLTPLAKTELASGPHRLQIHAEGYVSLVRDIDIEPKNVTRISALLVPLPATYDELWWNAFLLQMGGVTMTATGLAAMGGSGFAFWWAERIKQENGIGLGSAGDNKTLVTKGSADEIVNARGAGIAGAVVGVGLLAGGLVLLILTDYPQKLEAAEAAGAETAEASP